MSCVFTLRPTFASGVLVLSLALSACASVTVDDAAPTTAFTPEIETVLQRHVDALAALAADPVLRAAVQASNLRHDALSAEEREAQQQAWQRSAGDDAERMSLQRNAAALRLLVFQEETPGMLEVFLTDRHGLNVAQTNVTSDYYQADESWWQSAWNDGAGRAFHGELEFDESAKTESVPLHVPVYDASGVDIGVMKAVLDTTVIQQTFWNLSLP